MQVSALSTTDLCPKESVLLSTSIIAGVTGRMQGLKQIPRVISPDSITFLPFNYSRLILFFLSISVERRKGKIGLGVI